VAGSQGWKTDFGIDNLLDKLYYDHLGGVNRVIGSDVAVNAGCRVAAASPSFNCNGSCEGNLMQRTLLHLLLGLALASPALADTVKVDNAWVRATAPGQKVAGGFMSLTADADMTLVGGSSPVSKSLELHFMKMEKRRHGNAPGQGNPLPKGKT